jgi:hypothetical protein
MTSFVDLDLLLGELLFLASVENPCKLPKITE